MHFISHGFIGVLLWYSVICSLPVLFTFSCTTFKLNNTIRVLSCNVKGLNNVDKLCKIKNHFLYPIRKEAVPNIYTFQESGPTPEVTCFWDAILPGPVAYAHGTHHSKGVLLGIHPSSNVSLKSSIQDENGHYIVAECMLENELFTIASVYLEPSLNAVQFIDILHDIARKIDHFRHAKVLWVGDFNVVINPNMDSSAVTNQVIRKQSHHNNLYSFLDDHELTDVWRAMHPFQSHYTVRSHWGGGKSSLSQTDYFLLSPAMLTMAIDSTIEDAYASDHNAITYSFTLGMPNGKGYWKFPDFLTSDVNFKNELKQRIQLTLSDNEDTDPSLLWDVMKSNIRGCAIDYLAHEK